MTPFDRAEILRGLQAYHEPGDVFEIRVPKAGRFGTMSGYFDNFDAAADAVVGLEKVEFPGIFFTINPVDPVLLSRSVNHLKRNVDFTTEDEFIVRLNWLPIDLDPKRPKGISSTDGEHSAAIEIATGLKAWLVDQGWPAGAFILADSGNGCHLDVRIELNRTPENVKLVEQCLEALRFRFSDEIVDVDTTSKNPSRIWKLPGTMARKGDSTQNRPHRMAHIIEAPASFDIVPVEKLAALAALLPEQEEKPNAGYSGRDGFDPVAYCKEHNLEVHHSKPWKDGTIAILERCVFNPDHKLTASVIGWPNGARTYNCFHNSCQAKRWKDFKSVIEPGQQTDDEDTRISEITPEQLTKATGKMDKIDPDTGENVIDENHMPVRIPKRVLSPSRASKVMGRVMMLRISERDTSDKSKIWRYDSGIWKPDGEAEIVKTIDSVIGDLSYGNGLTETLRRIRSQSTIIAFDSNPYLFPTLDGVVDLTTGAFREARPEDYITFRYGAEFNNSSADYRLFLWLLCSSLPDPRDVLTALDIITAIAIRVPFEIIVLLFGGGSNGKGKFEKVILALFTMARATAIKLDEMKRSRFGPGVLLNKDVWIVTEVETVKDAMSVLKAEATGELIDSDVKYGDRVQGMPHAISMLDANNPLNFGDDSYGRKRRLCKLDFPYTFGDESGMRPIDRHLEEKLITPEVLSGIVRIIAARAPELVRSRRIYRRKGTDEQEDELRRQQFHLATFCDDCIRTADTWPYTDKDPQGAKPKKLKVDDAYNAYREYCRLFNVTTPAEKVPFGRYIVEKYGEECQSINTSETVDKKKVDFRYYPNLYLVKSAERAFAEAKIPFNDTYDSNDTSTTDLRQIWDIENSICGNNTTNTTDKVLSRVINEIEAMFGFILSCKDEREITYESYLKTSVVSVVSVVNGQVIPVIPTTDEKNSVVEPEGSVVGEKPTSIEADLLRADEQEKAKNRHFGGVAAKLTRSKKGEPLNSNDLICHRLRQAVIRDFGMRDGGRIDPCLVAAEVRVPLDLVCRWLEKRGYVEIVENEEVYYRPSEYVGTEKLDSLKDLSDEDSATTSQLAIIDYIPGELDD